MRKMIRLTIVTEPTAKGRARTTMRNGKVWTFTPTKTQNAQKYLVERLTKHQDKAFLSYEPVMLTATFYRTKSKYLPKRETLPVRKPDLDNFLKLVTDALKGVLVPDDAQITSIHARKRWTDKPHSYIELRLESDIKL